MSHTQQHDDPLTDYLAALDAARLHHGVVLTDYRAKRTALFNAQVRREEETRAADEYCRDLIITLVGQPNPLAIREPRVHSVASATEAAEDDVELCHRREAQRLADAVLLKARFECELAEKELARAKADVYALTATVSAIAPLPTVAR